MPHAKLLTPDEERVLASRIRKGGPDGLDARNELVMHNQGLAYGFALKYRRRGVELDDLVSVANLALLRAARDFDPGPKETRFSTYATWWMRDFVARALLGSGAVRAPYRAIHQRRRERRGEMLTNRQRETLRLAGLTMTSARLDIEPADGLDTPDVAAIRAEDEAAIERAMRVLVPREQAIVRSYYGFGCEPADRASIGRELGLCRERIRQIEVAALARMRTALSSNEGTE